MREGAGARETTDQGDGFSIQRFVRGLTANVYSQGVSITTQLIAVPIFLMVWDLEQYGKWLVFAAIPAYLGAADFGLLTAASTKLSIEASRNQMASANLVFRDAIRVCCFLVGLSGLIAALVLTLSRATNLLSGEAGLIICFLLGAVVVAQTGVLSEALFRAHGRYAIGTTLAATSRLAEWVGTLAGLLATQSLIGTGAGLLAGRVIATGGMLIFARHKFPGFSWRPTSRQSSGVSDLIGPGLGAFGLTIASALGLQGFTIMVGALLGPASVAVFNTYRTIARVAVQATSLISFAAWPEFSFLIGAKNVIALRVAFWRLTIIANVLACIAAVAMWVFLGPFVSLWTGGAVTPISSIGLMISMYALVASLWHVPRTLLLAGNQQTPLAITSVLVSGAILGAGAVLARAYGLVGVVGAMLIIEVILCPVAYVLARRSIDRLGES